MIVKSSDEVEPKPKASSTVSVSLLENPKDFEFADDVFGEDTFDG